MNLCITDRVVPCDDNGVGGTGGSATSTSRRSVLTGRRTASSGAGSTKSRRAASLPNEAVEYLKAWIMSPDHIHHPYPTEAEKVKIMEDTGIEMKQLTNWFVNNRKRFWKPRVEAKMREEKKLHKCASQQQQQILCSLVSNDDSSEEEPEAKHVVISDYPDCKPFSAVVSPQRFGSTRSSGAAASESTVLFPLLRSTDSALIDGSGSPPSNIRTISVNNSVVSLKDLLSADDDDESTQKAESFKKSKPVSFPSVENQELQQEQQHQLKSETIDVHILRPTDGSTLPLLGDVTVLSNVPPERILRTFENCAIHYCPVSGKDSKSPRRDAEIVRIKKHYLGVYLIEMAASTATSDSHVNMKKRSAVSVHVVTPDDAEENPVLPKEAPRRKYRRQSVELWKKACQTASHVYDQNLPSLEEAAQLFGYSSCP